MPLYQFRDGELKPVVPIRVIGGAEPTPCDCIIIQPLANADRVRDTTANKTHTTTDFIETPQKSYDISI